MYFSKSKRLYMNAKQMHSQHLLNALRQHPSNTEIYEELKLRLEKPSLPTLFRMVADEIESLQTEQV